MLGGGNSSINHVKTIQDSMATCGYSGTLITDMYILKNYLHVLYTPCSLQIKPACAILVKYSFHNHSTDTAKFIGVARNLGRHET